MLRRIKVWWVVLAAAAAAVGLPNANPAGAGMVAPRDATRRLASDGFSVVPAYAASAEPLPQAPLDFDGLNLLESPATGRGSDPLTLPQFRRIGFGLGETEDTTDTTQAFPPAGGEALDFQFTDAAAVGDITRFASVGAGGASPLSSDTGTAVTGQAGAEGETSPQTRVARPLAIPLPPAAALFPLGVAAALWARRWFRG